jgi:hypothetical protein
MPDCGFLKRAILSASILLAANLQTLNAQLAPGTHVRVRHAAGAADVTTMGTVMAVTPESLSVGVTQAGAPLVIRRDSIISLEAARVGGNNMREGAIVGALAGGIAGGLIASTTSGCTEGSDDCFGFLDILAGVAAGGWAGVALGGILGWQIKSEKWEEVQLPARVSVGPSRQGLRISFVARF